MTSSTQLLHNQQPLKALYNPASHSHVRSGVSLARRQPARREQCVRRLAQGHLDTLGGAGDRTSDLPDTRQLALPPEPHAPSYHYVPRSSIPFHGGQHRSNRTGASTKTEAHSAETVGRREDGGVLGVRG